MPLKGSNYTLIYETFTKELIELMNKYELDLRDFDRMHVAIRDGVIWDIDLVRKKSYYILDI